MRWGVVDRVCFFRCKGVVLFVGGVFLFLFFFDSGGGGIEVCGIWGYRDEIINGGNSF